MLTSSLWKKLKTATPGSRWFWYLLPVPLKVANVGTHESMLVHHSQRTRRRSLLQSSVRAQSNLKLCRLQNI